MDDTPEPPTRLVNMNHLGRALLDYNDPPVQMLFVYNCNPLATMPDQNRVLAGPAARGPLHRRLRAGVHRHRRYADVVLPATTFLENYDIAKGYGPISLQLVRPVVEPRRRGATERGGLLGACRADSGSAKPEEEIDTLLPRGRPLPEWTRDGR